MKRHIQGLPVGELVIDSRHCERQYWRDLRAYGELFVFLAWRDVLIRYKQTLIGILWAVIRPFLAMVVFTILFGHLAGMPGEGTVPYSIMVYAAALPWQFVSSAVTDAGGSLVGNANLISKIYFPRLIIPIGAIITSLIDFLFAGAVMVALFFWHDWWPDWRLLLLPFFIVLAFAAAAGPGLLLAALNVKYRDFRFVVPFLVQFGLYISPVGFSSGVVPDQWRLLYACNPMVGVIGGFRWALLGGEAALYWPDLIISIVVVLGFLTLSIVYFRKVERTFADFI
ncbi:MAG: ABC transporter permease [Syntrophobacteraceae bacterium]